jgi:serine/threonine protein kinase
MSAFEAFESFYAFDEDTKAIGEGATCKVRLARKYETDELCAVKVFDRNALRNDQNQIVTEADIRREATVYQQLANGHPNIVKFLGYYQNNEDYLYMVFEYLSGGELFDEIVSKQFYNEKEAKDLAKTILEAINYCHQKNIVHR